MTTFHIERDYPAPKRTSGGAPAKYPFSEMQIGDSFFVQEGFNGNVYSAASKAGMRYQRTFIVRKVDGGIRVWRVE